MLGSTVSPGLRTPALRCAAALVIVVSAACAPKTAQRDQALPNSDRDAIARLIESAFKAFADNDSSHWMAAFANDATLQAEHQPLLKGEQAIRQWVEALPPRTRMDVRSTQIKGAGDAAFVTADYEASLKSGARVGGRGLMVVNRMDSGWRIAALSFSTDHGIVGVSAQTSATGAKPDASPAAQIAIAVIGGFLGWLIVQGVSFLVLRRRLLRYLLAHINTRTISAKSNVDWFSKLANKLVVNVVPDDAPRYLTDSLSEIRDVREMFLYLRPHELQRMTRFLADYQEIEFRLEGVAKTVCDLSQQKKPVSQVVGDNVRERVKLCSDVAGRWPNLVAKLADLPE